MTTKEEMVEAMRKAREEERDEQTSRTLGILFFALTSIGLAVAVAIWADYAL